MVSGAGGGVVRMGRGSCWGGGGWGGGVGVGGGLENEDMREGDGGDSRIVGERMGSCT